MTSKHIRRNPARSDQLAALRLAIVYLILGGAWILFSDTLLHALVTDPERLASMQMLKGWFYVAVTAAVGYWALAWSLQGRSEALESLRENQTRYKSLFEDSPISVWEEDFSGVKDILDGLKQSGVQDLRAHFNAHPDLLKQCARAVRILDVNQSTLDLFGYERRDDLRASLDKVFREDSYALFLDELVHFASGAIVYQVETVNHNRAGDPIYVKMSILIVPGFEDTWGRVFVTLTDITARVLAERKLLSEKQFSETMIESMPGIIYFYDMNGKFLRWNHNFETVSGYSADEISRMTPLDFFADFEKPRVQQRISEVFRQGESSVEAQFLTKNGDHIPYFFTGRSVEFEGKPCLVGMGIDVSERRLAEDRMAESERKYRELVEYANSIILRWNAQGRITMLNEYGQRFFGYSADEIIGLPVVGTIVPATETSGRDLERLMEQICAHPELFEQNINENVRRNGERAWIAWTNRIVLDADGKVAEILSIGADITSRKRAEEALRESEARFRTFFECAPDGIVISDADGRCLDANPSLSRMLGFSRDELLALRQSDLAAPSNNPEPHWVPNDRAADQRLERRLQRKDGTTFDAEFISAPMPDGNLLGMIRDVSERKLAEAEREKRQQAEAADRIKSAFLATMSHELRTPLNSIIGFTGIILQGLAGPLNPEQTKQLTMVRASARHLLALVNDVLDISKIEAGQFEVNREPFDVPRSIDKALALVKPQAEAKRLALTSLVDPRLDQAVGDERRFEQILLNLLSNAVKFTSHGGVDLTADLLPDDAPPDGRSPRPAMRITVSDTGMGIKQEDMDKLFQPFRQIDSGLARVHEGTGLGLAICRRLADLMGGEISATSEWEKGSTFIVTIPLQPGGRHES